ncbi:MAG: S-layer homology domain-containing protein [Clostridia bacterium]|nr:S-layer homology domain-containing protein [Clostridia bacterium]
MLNKLLRTNFIVLLFLISSIPVLAAGSETMTRYDCVSVIMTTPEFGLYSGFSGIDTTILAQYSDAQLLTDEYSKQIVSAALHHGLIQGYDDKTLRLDNKVSRAEFSCMIYRIRENLSGLEDIVLYSDKYADVSAWNRDAISFCIEKGLMIGQGEHFGAEEGITYEQYEIIKRRLLYGLTTREKYWTLHLGGASPISMEDVLNSAYALELAEVKLPAHEGDTHGNLSSAEVATKMENHLELLRNVDASKLRNDFYRAWVTDALSRSWTQSSKKTSVCVNGGEAKLLETLISEGQNTSVVRESIVVFSPVYSKHEKFFPAYQRYTAVGYEYFCYFAESEEDIPEGFVSGIWYRQKLVADIRYHQSSMWQEINIQTSDLVEL